MSRKFVLLIIRVVNMVDNFSEYAKAVYFPT
jgi:hypothetical protein